jgi:RimJ/RimL family protein N-acetyltransferase
MITLRGDVTLAPLTLDHAPAMAQWMLDPVVRDNLGLRREPSPARTDAWVAAALADPAIHPFAILRDGVHVGNVVLDRVDDYLRSARFSIYLGTARGAGVGRTGAYLALREGFTVLDLHKIWLTVHVRNAAAIGSYLGLGFRMEGILRDEFRLHDAFIDVFYLGLLAEEFARLPVEWAP